MNFLEDFKTGYLKKNYPNFFCRINFSETFNPDQKKIVYNLLILKIVGVQKAATSGMFERREGAARLTIITQASPIKAKICLNFANCL
jgi:hypothetical protein